MIDKFETNKIQIELLQIIAQELRPVQRAVIDEVCEMLATNDSTALKEIASVMNGNYTMVNKIAKVNKILSRVDF